MNNFQIREKRGFHEYFTQIPNCVYMLLKDPFLVMAYSILKKIAGDGGVCYYSNKNLADMCGMSERKFRECKKALASPFPELDGKSFIVITKRFYGTTNSRNSDLIEIEDLWMENTNLMNKKISTCGRRCQTLRHEVPDPPAPGAYKEYQENNNQKEETTSPKSICSPSSDSVALSEQAFGLSDFLFSLIKENNDKAKKPDREKWATEIYRMNQIDGYSFAEIEALIRYSQADKFWSGNILSTQKLREKAPQLVVKMKNASKAPVKAKKSDLEMNNKRIAYNLWTDLKLTANQMMIDDEYVRITTGKGCFTICYNVQEFDCKLKNALRSSGIT